MIGKNIFYYPYASLGEKQMSMLKAVALYFDKLFVLDPMKSSWARVGLGEYEHEIQLLESEGILQRVSPEEVMHQYEQVIASAIHDDLNDAEYRRLCDQESTASWTLALAKVPESIRDDPKFQPIDQSMRNTLNDVGQTYYEGSVYDEYIETYAGATEFRFADYPFAVGEAIMLNHALIGSLLYTDAVPLTDELIHSKLLNYKLKKAQQVPEIRAVIEDRRSKLDYAHASAAVQALSDIDLGVIPTEMSLERFLEYRTRHKDELAAARDKLDWMVREINQQPWTTEFDDEINHKLIPQLHDAMKPVQKSWSKWTTAAGIALGGAAVALGIFGSPLTPVAVGVAGLTVAKDVGLGGFDWYQDWKNAKSQNGLHYLMKLKDAG